MSPDLKTRDELLAGILATFTSNSNEEIDAVAARAWFEDLVRSILGCHGTLGTDNGAFVTRTLRNAVMTDVANRVAGYTTSTASELAATPSNGTLTLPATGGDGDYLVGFAINASPAGTMVSVEAQVVRTSAAGALASLPIFAASTNAAIAPLSIHMAEVGIVTLAASDMLALHVRQHHAGPTDLTGSYRLWAKRIA